MNPLTNIQCYDGKVLQVNELPNRSVELSITRFQSSKGFDVDSLKTVVPDPSSTIIIPRERRELLAYLLYGTPSTSMGEGSKG